MVLIPEDLKMMPMLVFQKMIVLVIFLHLEEESMIKTLKDIGLRLRRSSFYPLTKALHN